MDNTIRFDGMTSQNTIPALYGDSGAHMRKPRLTPGTVFEGYHLLSLIRCTGRSEVWYCLDGSGYGRVLKVTVDHPDAEVIALIRETDCGSLVPILDCGESGGQWYEVSPYYREGSLQGRIDPEVIRSVVLPGITEGLKALHGCKVIHNDLKPLNIYWDDNRQKVLIGDYGSAAMTKTRPRQITPQFAAPELLYGNTCGRASDWCSVGLTLAALVKGEPLFEAQTVQRARRIWERGVRFRSGQEEDADLQRLINGMINMDIHKRMGPKAAMLWCEGGVFGGEERSRKAPVKTAPDPLTVAFHDPEWIAADIEGLIRGIEDHWDYSLFLFRQGRLDRFLGQFDKELILLCRELRKMVNEEDAMYYLTMERDRHDSYVWRGRRYHALTEMEETWKNSEEGRNDIVVFLQRGHVAHYLKKKGADEQQTGFAQRLQAIGKIRPNEACGQLFQALRGNDGLSWDGTVLKDIEDLVNWMATRVTDMDEAVDEIMESSELEAWLAYQGMGDILENIRRKCDL